MNIVIVDCFDTWEHRVDLIHNVLTEEGHNVRCFISDYRHFAKIKRTDEKQDFKFFSAEPYNKNLSVARLRSHIRLSRDIFSFIEHNTEKIDLLWVLAPPNCFVRDAGMIKRRYPEIKLIIDLIDLWPETMPVGVMKKAFFPWRQLRDKNLKYADVIVTECNLYRTVLNERIQGMRVETLYLARDDMGYEPHLNLPKNKIALCYLGSINNIIDIDGIVKIVIQCSKDKDVIFHIVGNGEKKNELMKKIRSIGAEVIDHGVVYDRREKQRIFDSCHYGLNMMKQSVCVGLTMKSVDYFEFGLPVINNINGDTWNIVEYYGCGRNVNPRDGYKLKDICTDGIEYDALRAKMRQFFIDELSSNVFRRKLLEIIG